MKTLLLLAILSTASPLAAAPDFFAPLTLGPHPVGFAEWRHRELTVSVWYPAARGGSRMTFGDYLGPRRGAFEEFLAGARLSAESVEAYLHAGMSAVRDASPRGGRFPVVLIAQGNQHDAADQAVLAEYLASHGWIVATTPSPMIRTPMKDLSETGRFAELQADQLRLAIEAIGRRLRIDRTRIAVIGHSFGARAALLLAMKEPRVRALVSLDGGIGTATAVEHIAGAPSFLPGHVPPLLHFYETEDAFMKPDFTFLKSVGAEALHTERIAGLHHVHFSTTGFAAAALKEVGRLTQAPDDTAASLAYIALRTRRFLEIHLRSRPSTLEGSRR